MHRSARAAIVHEGLVAGFAEDGAAERWRRRSLPSASRLSRRFTHLKRNFARCSVPSLNLTKSIRHAPLQDRSVFQT